MTPQRGTQARAMLLAMLYKRHHDGGYSPDLYEIDPFIVEAIHAAREWERAEKYVDKLCEKISKEK
jgi:hypothetical protein